MLEEHQTQHWSLADRAKQGRGLMYLGQLPCKIIMTSKELVDYEIFVLHCTWHFLRATHAFFFYSLTRVHVPTLTPQKLFLEKNKGKKKRLRQGSWNFLAGKLKWLNGCRRLWLLKRSGSLMGRRRCYLTRNAARRHSSRCWNEWEFWKLLHVEYGGEECWPKIPVSHSSLHTFLLLIPPIIFCTTLFCVLSLESICV